MYPDGTGRNLLITPSYIYMSPLIVKYILDSAVLVLGLWVMVRMVRSSLGGTVGSALWFILIGIFILAANHLADTAFFADALKAAGHTTDYLQSPIVHRAINLTAFVLMALGFGKLTSAPR